jgi:hypothetical protein
MTPIQKCKMLYTPQSPRTFEEDVTAHMAHGYLFATPEYFLMGRPVWSLAPQDHINDVWHTFPPTLWDAWYVYAFALADDQGLRGLVKKLLRHIPFYLPLIAWERSGHPLTFFSTDQLIQKYALLQLVQD